MIHPYSDRTLSTRIAHLTLESFLAMAATEVAANERKQPNGNANKVGHQKEIINHLATLEQRGAARGPKAISLQPWEE